MDCDRVICPDVTSMLKKVAAAPSPMMECRTVLNGAMTSRSRADTWNTRLFGRTVSESIVWYGAPMNWGVFRFRFTITVTLILTLDNWGLPMSLAIRYIWKHKKITFYSHKILPKLKCDVRLYLAIRCIWEN